LVSRVAETDGLGDSVLLTLFLDIFDVGMELFLGLSADCDMVPRVVADFKSVIMELLDLSSCNTVLFFLTKSNLSVMEKVAPNPFPQLLA
jgi:hypothetical protein